jgi:hypothetical protein
VILLALIPLFLLGLLATAIFSVPGAFIAMLLLGALHSHVAAVPALGFVPTYFAYLLARLVFGDSPSVNSDS